MYLYRKNRIEFQGTKKQVISYLLTAYEDDYFVQEYADQLVYDNKKLHYVITNLGMYLRNKKHSK